MIEVREVPGLVELKVSGTLSSDDYERLVPRLERLVAESGPLRFYIELHDFHGWTPAGMWKDIRFDMGHQEDMARIAIVGEKRWQDWAVGLSQPFLKADMRFFHTDEADAARQWVRADRNEAS